jgi:hypothetical protein
MKNNISLQQNLKEVVMKQIEIKPEKKIILFLEIMMVLHKHLNQIQEWMEII